MINTNFTLFIVKAYANNSDEIKTLESFKGRADQIYIVDSLFDVNYIDKHEEGWYGVFYDNESIADELLVALEDFFNHSYASVLVAFKRYKDDDGIINVSKCPRFFRNNVELKIDCLQPLEGTKVAHQIMLNGWVEQIDNNKV